MKLMNISEKNEDNQFINNFYNESKNYDYQNNKNLIKTIRLRLKASLIISIILINNIYVKINSDLLFLKPYEKYVNACKQERKISRKKIFNETPYISVCLAALNMRLYMKQNLLSILNQSFQDFEIIIVNDYSKDETESIIRNLQIKDRRIKLVNHSENLGVYRSRIEAILNAKGEYILLMDPDDMFMNQNLFKVLHNYNSKNNLDIVEFSVYQQKEGEKKIFLPDNPYETHYHGFPKEIISQPELSNILYYFPGTKDYSKTICRNIWNKIIRRKVFLKVDEYIGKEYYDAFVITADDMLMNVIAYQYAQNYSNIILPGYLYNIRNVSMSRGEGGIELKKVRTINHYQYFFLLYKYLKDFDKDRNFLMFEMKDLNHYVLFIKDLDLKEYVIKEIAFLEGLLIDNKVGKEFRDYINQTLAYFMK
jgi:glycosyltransferase involved in cell wall biosynthesis